MSEKVLVFRESVLNEALPGFSGVLTGDQVAVAIDKIMHFDNLFYRDRKLAEDDKTLKQVIPYIVVRNKNRILSYRRTKKSGESRLQLKRSIGFGGHINPHDGDEGIAYEKCFWRELAEELSLERQPGEEMPTPSALLYESDTEVGQVHFGIVHVLDVSDDFVFNPEADEAVGGVEWLDEEYLHLMAETPGEFEGWSEMVIKQVLQP